MIVIQSGEMRAVEALSALRDNYIWLGHLDGDAWLVVDPGEAAPVLNRLSDQRVGQIVILLTHHHGDHIAGAPEIAARYPSTIIGPRDPRIPRVDIALEDGATTTLPGAATLTALAVPGHTRTHLAFVIDDAVFCGDTLFSAGCGRMFEGDATQMHASLMRIAALSDAARVYCGHEYTEANLRFARSVDADNKARDRYAADVAARRAAGLPSLPSTIAIERAVNPFLRADDPGIAAAVGLPADAPAVDVFARLRVAKDHFNG